MRPRVLRQGIGLASLCVGLVMTIAPTWMVQTFGMGQLHRLMRVMGLRDLVIGLGMLSGRAPLAWVRARACSDAADALLMAGGVASGGFHRGRGILGLLIAGAFSGFEFWLASHLRHA